MRERRKWLARMIVALDMIASCAIVFWEPNSLIHRLMDRAGITGHAAVLGLAIVAMGAFCDVLINDLLPARFCLRRAIQHRHMIYAMLSLGSLSVCFVIVKTYGFTFLLFHYGLMAVAALLIALFDIHDRVRERQQ